MNEFDTGLTRAEIERLACFVEEMGECCQIVGKTLRFGYESYSPYDPEMETNRQKLEREMGDLQYRISKMIEKEDVSAFAISQQFAIKEKSAPKFDRNQ